MLMPIFSFLFRKKQLCKDIVMEFQVVREVTLTLVVMCCWSALTVNAQTVPKGCEGEADVIFLLDSTGLFNKGIHTAAKEFIARQIMKLQVAEDRIRVGVASMDGNGVPEMLLKDSYNKQEIVDRVKQIPFRNAPSFSYRNSIATIEENMMQESSGGRPERVPQIIVPVITAPPSADIADQRSQGNSVVIGAFKSSGPSFFFDIPPGARGAALQQQQDKIFFFEDESGLNEIDDRMNKKICEEIPGKNMTKFIIHVDISVSESQHFVHNPLCV